jgi:hypothetical protein
VGWSATERSKVRRGERGRDGWERGRWNERLVESVVIDDAVFGELLEELDGGLKLDLLGVEGVSDHLVEEGDSVNDRQLLDSERSLVGVLDDA